MIDIISAQYQSVLETVLVREASTRIETIPATYATMNEPVEVRSAEKNWYISDRADSPKASAALLSDATDSGFNLEEKAIHGLCYHEHYYSAKYETYSEQVLIKEEETRIDHIPARFGLVDKQILVEPAKEKIVPVPAVYEEISESVIDTPARNEWQQCGGAENSLNQVMCFVNIPATYKTITRRVLKTPATTRTEMIPAQYKNISIRELIEEAKEIKTIEPAQYAVVTKNRQIEPPSYIWHEIHGGIESQKTRTGRMICYRETPAEYRIVSKQIIVTPESSVTVEVPAEYRSISVQKEISPEQASTRVIPALYESVSRKETVQPGRMEWRNILCESDLTADTVRSVQQALSDRGYKINKIDGKFGDETKKALNYFQEDQKFPISPHIDTETLRVLGL